MGLGVGVVFMSCLRTKSEDMITVVQPQATRPDAGLSFTAMLKRNRESFGVEIQIGSGGVLSPIK